MAITNKLQKFLHRKTWAMCTPCIANTSAGSFVVSDKYNTTPDSLAFMINGTSGIYRYDANEDAWLQLPNSGAAGSFNVGSCGEYRGLGAMGGVFTQTATAGTTTTITTNRTIVRSLKGCRIRVVAGTGIGYDSTITSNTLGANAILTVPTSAVAFDATTQFQVYSGSLWFFNAGTTAVGFSVYDLATNSWTARSVTGLPTAWGTDARLVSTIGFAGSFATGTATSATSTTLVNSGKAWLTNQWANYQIRITAGTGKGQIRSITSNTGTTLTVPTWTVTPDATSVYSIEGNDDYMYLLGNGSVTMYRFVVSTNTWSTLSPTAARAGAAGAGLSASWIDGVDEWALPSNEAPSLHYSTTIYGQNGRYIYSFRGGAGNVLDAYDIAANTWISGIAYGNQNETFTGGSCEVDVDGFIFIQKDTTGRIYRFDVYRNTLQSLTTNLHPNSTSVTGTKMFVLPFSSGSDHIHFLYSMFHSRSELTRMMLF